ASSGWLESRRWVRPRPWQRDVIGSELLVAGTPPPPGLEAPGLIAAVESRLGLERSTFRRADVVVALAALCPAGAPAGAAYEWAESFCARSHQAGAPSRARWSTASARRNDDRLVSELLDRQ